MNALPALESVIETVREASGIMTRGHFTVMEKGSLENIVTSSDIAVQNFLMERLSALLPGSSFFCEEEDALDMSGEYVWIIDPIDGTANFSRGISDCCISVALTHFGEVVMGVVYSPGRGEMYSAVKGNGAFCNGVRMHVSKRPFREAILCTAMSTYRKEFAKACHDIIFDVYMRSNDVRRFGSAAIELCMLAAGQVELYFEMRLQPWDYAAGMLILKEAGGCISSFDGSEPPLDRAALVLAANCNDNLKELENAVHAHMGRLPY